jgi:hypothetical protein
MALLGGVAVIAATSKMFFTEALIQAPALPVDAMPYRNEYQSCSSMVTQVSQLTKVGTQCTSEYKV